MRHQLKTKTSPPTKLSNLLTTFYIPKKLKCFEHSCPSNPSINKGTTTTNGKQDVTSSTGYAGREGAVMRCYVGVSLMTGLSYHLNAYRNKPKTSLKMT